MRASMISLRACENRTGRSSGSHCQSGCWSRRRGSCRCRRTSAAPRGGLRRDRGAPPGDRDRAEQRCPVRAAPALVSAITSENERWARARSETRHDPCEPGSDRTSRARLGERGPSRRTAVMATEESRDRHLESRPGRHLEDHRPGDRRHPQVAVRRGRPVAAPFVRRATNAVLLRPPESRQSHCGRWMPVTVRSGRGASSRCPRARRGGSARRRGQRGRSGGAPG
jgi:hypothetical protein